MPESKLEAWMILRQHIKNTATHEDADLYEALGWLSPLTVEELSQLHAEEHSTLFFEEKGQIDLHEWAGIERTQATLSDERWGAYAEGRDDEAAHQEQRRTGTCRKNVPEYKDGRRVHRCSNCNAPHRRIDKETGYCKEPTCKGLEGVLE